MNPCDSKGRLAPVLAQRFELKRKTAPFYSGSKAMPSSEKCFLCGREATVTVDERDFCPVKCKICGDYVLHTIDRQMVEIGRAPWTPWKISAYTREKMIQRMPTPVITFRDAVPAGARAGTVTVNLIESYFPKTVADRLERTLMNLSRLSSRPGARIGLDSRFDYPIAFAENADVFDFLFSQLTRDGYVGTTGVWPGEAWLNVRGWNRIAELERGGAGSKTAFVAMSFHESLDDAWEKGLKPGIDSCGYNAIRVDLKEHNEKICDVIVAEVRKSKFVVADFTLHRNGVYFEAGFAMGLGRPVIFTCREDELDKAHFDTRQYNHIAWKDPEELRERIRLRIQATIVP